MAQKLTPDGVLNHRAQKLHADKDIGERYFL